MSKPVRYTLAVFACIACYAVCVGLMVATGIGGVIAMLLMCFAIKHIWNAIVHGGEEELNKSENESKTDESTKEDFQES